MGVEIIYMRQDLLEDFHRSVEEVAAERRFLATLSLPPFDPENSFGARLIRNDWPTYAALVDGRLVGWADIVPDAIPQCAHRGKLGMGIRAPYRGIGIGGRLLDACLTHAPRSGIETVELTVYANNASAIALYRRRGFEEIGLIRDYRRLDGETYDALLMERRL